MAVIKASKEGLVEKEAKRRIVEFCKKNGIKLDENILKVPVHEIDDFFEGRDQSGHNYSKAEAMEDLGSAKAFFLQVDDRTGCPAILYSKDRMEALDFEEQVQIMIHEYLHYSEVAKKHFYGSEAAVEAISILVNEYYQCNIEDAMEMLSVSVNPEVLIEAYGQDLGKKILKKIYKMSAAEVKKYLV